MRNGEPKTTRRRMIVLYGPVAFLVLLGAACGGDEGGDETPGAGGAETKVDATLKDFSISPSVTTVEAGEVTFVAENVGEVDHNLVVLRTDLAPDALPVEGNLVDEEASGIEKIGEIEAFEPGKTDSATFELSAGSYALICNVEGHYEAGMTVGFDVTS